MEASVDGPFGRARLVLSLPTCDVIAAYRKKCGADVSRWFGDLPEIYLFECEETRYRFWRPVSIAGDGAFYTYLSGLWQDYYRPERWEYPFVRRLIDRSCRVLEVGCGRGFFLKSIEDRVAGGMGIEFNVDAIAGKVTRLDIVNTPVERI